MGDDTWPKGGHANHANWKHAGEMCTWCPTDHWFGHLWDKLIKCTKDRDSVPHTVSAQHPVPRFPSSFIGISMIEVSRCKWISDTKLNAYCPTACIICWNENAPWCGRNTILSRGFGKQETFHEMLEEQISYVFEVNGWLSMARRVAATLLSPHQHSVLHLSSLFSCNISRNRVHYVFIGTQGIKMTR